MANTIYPDQRHEQIGKKDYIFLESLPALAQKVAQKHTIDIAEATIEFALVDPFIRPFVAGQCMLVSRSQYKLFTNVDYFITFSESVWSELSEEQQELLMCHELMHIGKIVDKHGEFKKWGLVQHDVMDFRYLIKRYGIDWVEFTSQAKDIMDEVQRQIKELRDAKKKKKESKDEPEKEVLNGNAN